MKLLCPHCGVKGSADSSYLGKKVKCPKCSNAFQVKEEMALVLPEELPVAPIEEETVAASKDEGPGIEAAQEDPPLSASEDTETIIQADELSATEAEENESLDWSDIEAEIEGQQEGDRNVDGDDDLEGSPADLNSLLEDYGAADENTSGLQHEESPPAVAGDDQQGEEGRAKVESGLLDPQDPEELDKDLAMEMDGIENEPYGMAKEQCWQCGKEDSVGEPFIAKDGRLYCTDCLADEDAAAIMTELADGVPGAAVEQSFKEKEQDGQEPDRPKYYLRFSIREAISEAWEKTKGAKGAIWAGSAVMYLVLLMVIAGGAFFLPKIGSDNIELPAVVANVLFQFVSGGISTLFMAGLVYMGVRKAAGDKVSWDMIFGGFPLAVNIIIAMFLQSLLIVVGFLLLVLPGIYLAVGYAMTLPLIVDRKLSPWQAMEVSRKGVHKVWWKVAGLFLIMGVVSLVALLPLGIGLIWAWPMFILLIGVIYRYIFGSEKMAG